MVCRRMVKATPAGSGPAGCHGEPRSTISRAYAAAARRTARRVYARKLDGAGEAHLVALACSAPPQGRARWTLRLLADRMVTLEYVDTISHETVRQVLKKTS